MYGRLKEQRGAARVISARATLDVLDLGTRLVAVSAHPMLL